jgi:nucleoside-diphosphate-sugar epimerase
VSDLRLISGKVAVVGANGFIGSRLVEQFVLNQIAEISPVVRGPSGLARLAKFDLDWRLADARDQDALSRALAGCELVVYAVVGDPRVIEQTATSLIPAAVAAGVRRIVYLSTASVHGLAPRSGTTELSPINSNQEFEYNNAKVRAERRLFKDAKLAGVELIALRPSIVFGPRDRWVGPLVNELLTGTAWLLNEGDGVCNSVYVDNLVYAIQAALVAPVKAVGQAYLITDDEEVTWRRFYERVASLASADASAIHFPPSPSFQAQNLRDQIMALRASPWAQRLIANVPSRLKRVVKASVEAWPEPVSRSPWGRVDSRHPLRLDRERVSLQQCRWQLPCAAAKQMLGYSPQVSFDDGMMRTVGWLRWAGQIRGSTK